MKALLNFSLCLALLACCGCRTPTANDKGETICISLLPSGNLDTGESQLPKTQLVRWLSHTGATKQSIIIIQIQDKTELAEVSSLTSLLASAGYRFVYFKRPQHAKSSVTAK